VCYNWPDLARQAQATPNELLVPLGQVVFYHPIRLVEARPLLRDAAEGGISYARLPMIFGSAIHQSVVRRVRPMPGTSIRNESPDVRSALASGCLAGTCYAVAAPMTIARLSGWSNGVAAISLRGKSPITEEFQRLNAGAQHGCPPRVPALMS